jgi:hypothetical protein
MAVNSSITRIVKLSYDTSIFLKLSHQMMGVEQYFMII